MRVRAILCAAAMMSSPVVVSGQVRNSEPDLPAPVADARAARTPDIDTGRIGQRQTREDVARAARIAPMARLNNRIVNRVQSRLRNRIDRNYDSTANASAPYAVAEGQLRTGGRARR